MILDTVNKNFWNMIDAGDNKRLKEQDVVTYDKVKTEKNLSYGSHGVSNLFDLYYPQNQTKPLPVIINIPGGGYTIGKKENNRIQSEFFAQHGFCVVTPNYRRIEEAKFPAPITDLFNLFAFLNKNYSQKLDFNNLFLLGDSAGAHIASLACCILKNDQMKLDFNVHSNLKVRACAFCSPCFKVVDIPLMAGSYKKMIYGDNLIYDKISSSLKLMDKDFPPTITVTPINDFIMLHAFQFKNRCKKLGVENKHIIIPHGKNLGHTCTIKYPHFEAYSRINEQIAQFFNKKMQKNDVLEQNL